LILPLDRRGVREQENKEKNLRESEKAITHCTGEKNSRQMS
jgi:hypothetical protein